MAAPAYRWLWVVSTASSRARWLFAAHSSLSGSAGSTARAWPCLSTTLQQVTRSTWLSRVHSNLTMLSALFPLHAQITIIVGENWHWDYPHLGLITW
jgi:hypothetical protein